MKQPILAVLAVVVAVGVVYADQSASKVVLPITRTSPNSGRQMYASYCASCHGMDGRGNGPVAVMLRKQPADLSALTRNNGGKYPTEHVMAVLEFGAASSAHGTTPMPVWGPILDGIDAAYPGQMMGTMRMTNLNKYLESMQEK